MPARQRSNNNASSETALTKHQDSSEIVAYKVGVFGWRKRCLYFLVLLVVIIAIINMALTIWIIRVLDFGLHGVGKLHITSNGMRMEGTAEFLAKLRAKNIMSRTDAPLKITSRKNISLSAVDALNNVMGQITLNSNQVVLKNKKLFIQDQNGRTLLYADDKKIKMDIENMDITVPGGLNFESSVQTPLVQASGSNDLHLQSLTKKLYIDAADDVNIKSTAHDVNLVSLMDMKLTSKKGKIVLDASKIKLKNLRQSTVPGRDERTGSVYSNSVAEVCMCKDGTLFLAPADSQLPCKVTSGVCVL